MCDFCGCKYGFTAESVGIGQDDLYEDENGDLQIKPEEEKEESDGIPDDIDPQEEAMRADLIP